MTMKAAAAAMAVAMMVAACGKGPTTPSAPPIPNYAGAWTGNYTITGCTQNGGMSLVNICGSMGVSAPYKFNFTQNGNSVTGSFALGTINFPSTGGTVGTDGSLGLQATTITNGTTIIATWALHNAGGTSKAITGTVTHVWTDTQLSGQANVAGSISTSILGASSVAGTESVTGAAAMPLTLTDLVRMAAGK